MGGQLGETVTFIIPEMGLWAPEQAWEGRGATHCLGKLGPPQAESWPASPEVLLPSCLGMHVLLPLPHARGQL